MGTYSTNPARKDKTVALLLAIFLGPWAWLYTWPRDSTKFWIGISAYVIGVPLILLFGLGILIILGIHIWAIVDVVQKSDRYYLEFPYAPDR